jgi:hypothetical protein
MGGASSAHGGDETCIQSFAKSVKETAHSEDQGVDERFMLK